MLIVLSRSYSLLHDVFYNDFRPLTRSEFDDSAQKSLEEPNFGVVVRTLNRFQLLEGSLG